MASFNLGFAFALICMVAVAIAPHAEGALTCGTVTSKVAQCMPYLRTPSPAPTAACCAGIRSLMSMATSTADKQTACNCLKSAAASISGINFGKASGLPGKCNVNIPYAISPKTDCSKVR